MGSGSKNGLIAMRLKALQDGLICECKGVREGTENKPVLLWKQDGRLLITAQCEENNAELDLVDLLAWVTEHRPGLLQLQGWEHYASDNVLVRAWRWIRGRKRPA